MLRSSAAQLRKRSGRQRRDSSDGMRRARTKNQWRRLFAVVGERFGKLDILVNNAGISQPPTSLLETDSLEIWREQIETNLTGVFLCSRAALPQMQAGATIINNLSQRQNRCFPQYYAYTAAKMGALGFTLTLREELMPRGIRVTALMPGATSRKSGSRSCPMPRSSTWCTWRASRKQYFTRCCSRPKRTCRRSSWRRFWRAVLIKAAISN